MTNREAAEWSERFWRLAGRIEPFPRCLESSVAWALPLVVVKLPRLGLSKLRNWLAERGIAFRIALGDRPLRACLLARAGRGIVFLDGSDPPNEQRFSLAHELAHFLMDYLLPREKALEALGQEATEVLDGKRPPSLEERLTGMLQGVELGTFTHLMDRSSQGYVDRIEVLEAEDRADRLALELLAPRPVVLARLHAQGIRCQEASAAKAAQKTLVEEFGLPGDVAEGYGSMLIMGSRGTRSFKDWLGVQ